MAERISAQICLPSDVALRIERTRFVEGFDEGVCWSSSWSLYGVYAKRGDLIAAGIVPDSMFPKDRKRTFMDADSMLIGKLTRNGIWHIRLDDRNHADLAARLNRMIERQQARPATHSHRPRAQHLRLVWSAP